MFIRFHTYLLEKTRSSFARRLQLPFVRRTLVVCGAVWLFVMAFLFSRFMDDLWFLILIDLPLIVLAGLLVLSIYGIFELPETKLDEHQLNIRNQAYKKAYGFSLIFLLVVIVLVFGLNMNKHQAFATALMSFLTIALAPRAIAAWTLKSLNEDEEFA